MLTQPGLLTHVHPISSPLVHLFHVNPDNRKVKKQKQQQKQQQQKQKQKRDKK